MALVGTYGAPTYQLRPSKTVPDSTRVRSDIYPITVWIAARLLIRLPDKYFVFII